MGIILLQRWPQEFNCELSGRDLFAAYNSFILTYLCRMHLANTSLKTPTFWFQAPSLNIG